MPDADLAEIGTTEENGTTVTFWPSADVFETTTYSYETLSTRFREMAFLNKGLEIVIRDERPEHTPDGEPVEQSFKYDDGLVDYVKYLTGTRDTVHREVISFEAVAGAQQPEPRDRDAVERLVQRVRAHVREHDQHPRGRHPRGGLPGRAHLRWSTPSARTRG